MNYDEYREQQEEKLAAQRDEKEAFREQLKSCNMDGPFEIPTTGGMFDFPFGKQPFRYAICTLCGSMIKLDDPIDIGEVKNLERGIYLHTAVHGPQVKEESDGEDEA